MFTDTVTESVSVVVVPLVELRPSHV